MSVHALIVGLILNGGFQGLPITREPVVARELSSSITLRCGRDTVNISGYGHVRPQERVPVIRFNGREIRGPSAAALRDDLSNPRAAYRLTGRCSQDARGVLLEIYSGEQVSGLVRYRAGRAMFVNGRVSYDGLEEANAETFWFR